MIDQERAEWSQRVRQHLRQEQAQGQIAPTDAALLMRLVEFLAPSDVAPDRAKVLAWAQDVRRYHRQEQAHGQVSPTDAAFLSRLAEFLSERWAPQLPVA